MRPTTTSGNSDLDPSFFGYPVTFTATVTAASGTPTGTVTFVDTTTATMLGTVRDRYSHASVKSRALAAGKNPIQANNNTEPCVANITDTALTTLNFSPYTTT